MPEVSVSSDNLLILHNNLLLLPSSLFCSCHHIGSFQPQGPDGQSAFRTTCPVGADWIKSYGSLQVEQVTLEKEKTYNLSKSALGANHDGALHPSSSTPIPFSPAWYVLKLKQRTMLSCSSL